MDSGLRFFQLGGAGGSEQIGQTVGTEVGERIAGRARHVVEPHLLLVFVVRVEEGDGAFFVSVLGDVAITVVRLLIGPKAETERRPYFHGRVVHRPVPVQLVV